MALEPIEQFKNFLEKSSEVLIIIPENPTGDAIGSAWALYFYLEKKNISPTIAFSNHLPEKFSFLPRPKKITNEISGARDFVLSFDITQNPIVGMRTETKSGRYNIYLTPEKGAIDPRDFSFILAKFRYDLIIIIDSPDLEKLGKIYEKNTDLFYEVPLVNIDYKSNNENFGQINLVDIMASSCSEIVNNFFESLDYNLIDKTIADCLLTGIISATDSFQKKNTTPRSMLIAATLMNRGADQQEIVKWLYKTHPLHILKLWGRVMSKLKWDAVLKLVWSELILEDFIQSRSKPEDLHIILEKLQENYSDGRFFMTLYADTPHSAIVLIKSSQIEELSKLQKVLGGDIKNGFLKISIASNDLIQIAQKIIDQIKKLEI